VSERPTDGWQIVFRYVKAFAQEPVRERLPEAVTLRWKYSSHNKGMPSKAELAAMYQLEDQLQRMAESKGEARLAIVQTGNNQRMWTYYATSDTVIRAALTDKAKYPVEVTSTRDPLWTQLDSLRMTVRSK
jgi:hypothetical protein